MEKPLEASTGSANWRNETLEVGGRESSSSEPYPDAVIDLRQVARYLIPMEVYF